MRFKDIFYENFHKQKIDKNNWRTLLYSKGWKQIGSGANARTFGHPHKNYVIKLYENDPGYDIFLNFIEQNQHDRHVVRIKKNIFTRDDKSSPGMNAIALEKLKPVKYGKNFDLYFDIVSMLGDRLKTYYTQLYKRKTNIEIFDMIVRDTISTSYAVKEFGITEKKFNKVISKIRNSPLTNTIFNLQKYMIDHNMNERFWDLHKGNFMIRPTTGELVITDPLV